jgi:hypothetical protein
VPERSPTPYPSGTLACCAIKDGYPNRMVGYSFDSRMKSRAAIAALENAVLAAKATAPT